MTNYTEIRLDDAPATPPPVSFRQVAYDQSQSIITHDFPLGQCVNTNTCVAPECYKEGNCQTSFTDFGLKEGHIRGKSGEDTRAVIVRNPIFWWLSGPMVYIRAISVIAMILSFPLVLTAVVVFSRHGESVPGAAAITDYPCRVFTGIPAMNMAFGVFLCFSCTPTKFRESNNAVNAVLTTISVVGFASSMGHFFLDNKKTLQQDLWQDLWQDE